LKYIQYPYGERTASIQNLNQMAITRMRHISGKAPSDISRSLVGHNNAAANGMSYLGVVGKRQVNCLLPKTSYKT